MKTVARNNITQDGRKSKRPYWTASRVASRFKVTKSHMSRLLAGQRESAALLQAVALFVGPDRFREMAAPEVVNRYLPVKNLVSAEAA